jgi:hypothetical protein
LGDTVVQGGLERAVIADVGLGRDDPPVERLDLLDRLGQVGGRGHRIGHRADPCAQVDRDDVGALLRESDGVAAALAAGRAGDECDFSFYPSWHRSSWG